MVRKSRSQKPASTLQEWQERTGTNNRQLVALLAERGENISEGHMCDILKGSRRCSLQKAILLHEITGVAIQDIAQWPPKVRKVRKARPSAKELAAKHGEVA